MPGIVGLITRMPRAWAEPQLRQMVDVLRHESFYVMGTWVDESLGIYVGWSARAGSLAESMPRTNERGDATLVFGGEEFSAIDTTGDLRRRGHEVGQDPADHLIHLYEDDPAFPAGLNGTFHGLVADRAKKTLTLFNDRYGMRRLYYHQGKDAFYFGAEAKAILAVRPELRRIDPAALAELIACGCVLEDRTVFEGVSVLPCGSKWTFSAGMLEQKAFYFKPQEWEDQPRLQPDAYFRALKETLSAILPRYFAGPEPIGMSLTGGLDSRMVMAWQRAPRGSLPCYSFGGMFRECEDVKVARRVAQICGQPHEVIVAGEDFLTQFPRYAERTVYISDGCADVSLCPDVYVYERARKIASVRLTGNLGGEVLRGVVAFKASDRLSPMFSTDLRAPIHAAQEVYARTTATHSVSFAVFRQAPWHHFGTLALEQMQLSPRTPYLDNDLVRAAYGAPADPGAGTNACLRLIADGNPALREVPTDRGVGGSSDGILAAAARSWHAFLFKAEYAYDYGMPHWLARADNALSLLHLERLILGRHKFYHFRTWYRRQLSGYIQDVLLDPRSLQRGYVSPAQVQRVVQGHVKGQGNYTTEIHKLLTLELLHRTLVDTAGPARKSEATPPTNRQPVEPRQ